MNNQIEALILDWAGTVVDFGSFAPTAIFVEAFAEAFDFPISLAEARVPMGLGKWDHIHTLGQLPEVAARWQARFGRPMGRSDVDFIYATFMPLQIEAVARYSAPIAGSLARKGDQAGLLLRVSARRDGSLGAGGGGPWLLPRSLGGQ